MRVFSVVVVAAACSVAPFVVGGCDAAPAAAAARAGPNAAPVTIETVPPGAAVLVDGQPAGNAPVTVLLNPGPHRLRASQSGYYPTQDTKIVVERGQAQTQTLTLVASH